MERSASISCSRATSKPGASITQAASRGAAKGRLSSSTKSCRSRTSQKRSGPPPRWITDGGTPPGSGPTLTTTAPAVSSGASIR